MKGHVLGFDGEAGAIAGEDGQRYRFTEESWKDQRPPTARDEVDFVAADGQATEIYRVKGTLAVSMSQAPRLDSGQIEKIKGYAARPQLLLAAVLVFASLFLTFISTEGEECCFALTEVHSLYAGMDEALDEDQALRESRFGDLDMMAQIAERQRQNQANWPRIALRALPWASYLLWLIPAGAALIVYRTLRETRRRRLEFATGLGAMLALAIVPVTRSAFSNLGEGMLGYALGQAANSIGYGFGAFVVALSGIGLILTALNRLTRTPGL